MSTYDELVALHDRLRDEPAFYVSPEDLDALQRAHVRCHGPRSGVTPGGIEWRSWS